MKIIGEATVTIRDAKTGKVAFQESHKNALTPALARILSSNIAGTLNYDKVLPIYSKLLGGVCLFNGSVSADDVYLPAANDATLTAHAGQHGFSTNNDTKRGTPNTSQSYVTSSAACWVWNWLQTNGNGRITDVVLTHADTGDYWNEEAGNNTMEDDFCPVERVDSGILSPAEFRYYRDGVDFPYVSNSEKIPLCFKGDNDHIISVSQHANKTIKIHIAKFTGKGIWMWNACGDVHDETVYTVETQYNRNYIAYDKTANVLHIISAGDSPTYNQTLSGKAVDLETGNATTWTAACSATLGAFTNYKKCDGTALPSSNVTLYCEGVGTYEPNFLKQLQVVSGCIFIPVYWVQSGIAPFPQGPTDCSIKINLADPSVQSIVKGFQDFNTSGYSDSSSQVQIDLGNGRVMNQDYMAWKNSSGSHEGQKVYHDTNIFPSTVGDVREYSAEQPVANPVQYMTHVSTNTGAAQLRGCILNKLFAATVFHLENAVTKNAMQTMTVSYTLTLQQEEQEGE